LKEGFSEFVSSPKKHNLLIILIIEGHILHNDFNPTNLIDKGASNKRRKINMRVQHL